MPRLLLGECSVALRCRRRHPSCAHQHPPLNTGVDDGVAGRVAYALRLWSESKPLTGTLGERYLIDVRKLAISALRLEHAVRWHAGINAVVGLMTDPASAQLIGVLRTFLLNADGTKREKKMIGRMGIIRLSPDDDVITGIGIAEGIEDGLAVLVNSWSPVWAATCCWSIARLPVLKGIESITIFADADKPGLDAAQTCCERWREAGREARIVAPLRSAA
jgi:putative DNA primase/helicase